MPQLNFPRDTQTIVVDTQLSGKITLHARLVVDTGASLVVLPWRIATGLDLPIDPTQLVKTSTAAAVESVPLTIIPKVTVLGKTMRNVVCMVKDLPAESGVDGLLGLSFLRHFRVILEMKRGVFTLK